MPAAPGDGTPGTGVAATGGVAELWAPLTTGAARNVKVTSAQARSVAPGCRGRPFENRYTRPLSCSIAECDVQARGMLLPSGVRVERPCSVVLKSRSNSSHARPFYQPVPHPQRPAQSAPCGGYAAPCAVTESPSPITMGEGLG